MLTIQSFATAALALMASSVMAHDVVKTETVHSQPSWILQNDSVRLAITHLGAMVGPVEFCRETGKAVQPYYISPWQDEGLNLEPPVLKALRGNFFCIPFGGNSGPYKGMKFLPHGEAPGAQWSFADAHKSGAVSTMVLKLQTQVPSGHITKTLHLVDGQNVIYTQERLEGYSLRTSIGHHAILAVPEKEGALKIEASEYQFGMTEPSLFSDPKNAEYQSFQINRKFSSLTKVPLAWKGSKPADCTAFPARYGFADLLAIFSKPASELPHRLAWTTATNDDAGYLWFSLRDPSILPTTVFWIENHGRHDKPWNGRNRCLGLEDVCSYLNDGMPISAEPNQVNAAGIPTSFQLNAHRPTLVNYVEGVAKVPHGFRKVKTVEFGHDSLTFISVTGKRVTVKVHHDFVHSGAM